jgi:hypothetical protein
MAYLDTQKPPEEVQKDKADCQAAVDSSGLKDAGLKQKKFNQCMKDKGYDVVSEEEAEKIQGFKGLWIKPGIDFKAYAIIFLDKIDLSQTKVETHIPGVEASQKEKNDLGEEMSKRFSQALTGIMPVVSDPKKIEERKALFVSLMLNKVPQANIGLNTGLEVVGQFTPSFVPMPDAPLGNFSFEAVIADYSTKEKLIILSDECEEDKNASFAGIENFEKWKHAYNMMDYWADHLAALLAKERGEKYKSRLGIKIVDF